MSRGLMEFLQVTQGKKKYEQLTPMEQRNYDLYTGAPAKVHSTPAGYQTVSESSPLSLTSILKKTAPSGGGLSVGSGGFEPVDVAPVRPVVVPKTVRGGFEPVDIKPIAAPKVPAYDERGKVSPTAVAYQPPHEGGNLTFQKTPGPASVPTPVVNRRDDATIQQMLSPVQAAREIKAGAKEPLTRNARFTLQGADKMTPQEKAEYEGLWVNQSPAHAHQYYLKLFPTLSTRQVAPANFLMQNVRAADQGLQQGLASGQELVDDFGAKHFGAGGADPMTRDSRRAIIDSGDQVSQLVSENNAKSGVVGQMAGGVIQGAYQLIPTIAVGAAATAIAPELAAAGLTAGGGALAARLGTTLASMKNSLPWLKKAPAWVKAASKGTKAARLAGSATFAHQAFGSYAHQSELDQMAEYGYVDTDRQMAAALLNATGEVLMENVLFFPRILRTADDGVRKQFTKNLAQNYKKIGGELLKGYLGEATEEALMEPYNNVVANALYGSDKQVFVAEDMLMSGAIGGLMGLSLSAGPAAFDAAAVRRISEDQAQFQDVILPRILEGAPKDSLSFEIADYLARTGKDITVEQKVKLAELAQYEANAPADTSKDALLKTMETLMEDDTLTPEAKQGLKTSYDELLNEAEVRAPEGKTPYRILERTDGGFMVQFETELEKAEFDRIKRQLGGSYSGKAGAINVGPSGKADPVGRIEAAIGYQHDGRAAVATSEEAKATKEQWVQDLRQPKTQTGVDLDTPAPLRVRTGDVLEVLQPHQRAAYDEVVKLGLDKELTTMLAQGQSHFEIVKQLKAQLPKKKAIELVGSFEEALQELSAAELEQSATKTRALMGYGAVAEVDDNGVTVTFTDDKGIRRTVPKAAYDRLNWSQDVKEETVDRIKANGGKVITSLDQFQKDIRNLMAELGTEVVFYNNPDSDSNGHYSGNNTLYINVAKTQNEGFGRFVVFHEFLHFLEVADADLYNSLVDLYQEKIGPDAIAAYRENILKDSAAYQDDRLVVMEMLSDEFGNMASKEEFWLALRQENKDLFETMVSKLRAFFKKMRQLFGGDVKRLETYIPESLLNEMENEFKVLVTRARQRHLAGETVEGGIGEVRNKFAAEHTTPHVFTKFDHSKMGTGEGAQVYGWGTYLSTSDAVREHYRRAFSQMYMDPVVRVTIGDRTLELSEGRMLPKQDGFSDAEIWAARTLRTFEGDLKAAISANEEALQHTFDDPDPNYAVRMHRAELEETLGVLKALKKKDIQFIEPKPQTLKVEVDAEIEHMLDWDKPLSEQSEYVQERLEERAAPEARGSLWFLHPDGRTGLLYSEAELAEASPEEIESAKKTIERGGGKVVTFAEKWLAETRGSDLYHDMASDKGSDKEASLYLNSIGIPGIKYLDGGSRRDGEGSYNFVVFDEDKMAIKDRYSRREDLEEAFKDSKVRGKDGKLLPVYHGSPSGDFTVFDTEAEPIRRRTGPRGAYFTDSQGAASSYASHNRSRGKVYEVFLNLVNPLDITAGIKKYQRKGMSFNEAKTEALKAFDPEVHDGIMFKGNANNPGEYVAFKPEQIKSLQGDNPVELDNPDIRYSVREDLVALHNISESKLLKAIALGGMPVPSIAVTKADIPFDSFGGNQITLVGDRALVDPENPENKVFDTDVYSRRVPREIYKVNSSALSKIMQSLEESFKAVDESVYGVTVDEYHNNGLDDLLSTANNRKGMKYHYLTKVLGQTVKIPMRDRARAILEDKAGAMAFAKANPDIVEADIYSLTDDQKRRVGALLLKDIPTTLKESTAQLLRDKRVGPDGMPSFSALDKAMNDLHHLGERVVDQTALRDLLDRKIRPKDFEAWVRETFAPVYGEKYFYDGNRKRPYTLDELFTFMSGRIKATEGFDYGPGNAKAKGAKKFSSIDQMHKSKHAIVTEEEVDDFKRDYEPLSAEMAAALTPLYQYEDSWGAMQEMYNAMGDYLSGKDAMGSLRRAGFKPTPEALDAFKKAADALKNAPVQYFEAKPQRVVQFREFKAALVHKSVKKSTVDAIKEAGVAKVIRFETSEEKMAAMDKLGHAVRFSERDFTDSEETKFLGACDRFRMTPEGEAAWQEMMDSRVEITPEAFAEAVDVTEALDEDETWEGYQAEAARQGDPVKCYKSNNGLYFFQTAGFEFIWRAGPLQVDPSGKVRYSARTWEMDSKEKLTLRKQLTDAGFAGADVDKWFDQMDSLSARILGEWNAYLDYIGDPDGEYVKPNREYTWSVDASTLCRKRLQVMATVEAIQTARGNFLTPEEMADVHMWIKNYAAEHPDDGIEVACALCYVESVRIKNLNAARRFIETYPKDVLDYHEGMKKRYPKRTVPKKADLMKIDPTLILTAEGTAKLKKEHPEVYECLPSKVFVQQKALLPRAAFKTGELSRKVKPDKVPFFNDRSGLRWQSWSDFEVLHLFDGMQVILEMAALGLKGHAYTKVPEFVKAFGKTGMMINLSVIAKGSGLDAKGNLLCDPVEGMPMEVAEQLRKDHPNTAGLVLVGVSREHILAAMKDARIDYIIPYHASALPGSVKKKFGIEDWTDFQLYQNEIIADKEKWKAFAENHGLKSPKDITLKMWWNLNLDGDANAKNYLALCDAAGLTPKFGHIKDQVTEKHYSFTKEPGYWKLLVDRKMYDNDGHPIDQKPVQPIYDDKYVEELMAGYKGTKDRPVEAAVEHFRKSERTDAFKEWFGDSKVVDANGEPLVVYHGTIAEFDVFKPGAKGSNAQHLGMFFTGEKEQADAYANSYRSGGNPVTLAVYLKMEHPLAVAFSDLELPPMNSRFSKVGYVISQAKKARKYDGVILTGFEDFGGGGTQYVVFSPTQIKSATDNVGTYDPENPDIRYSVGHHAGDLGKAEGLTRMTPGRGTGHFGTGTYFVGNKEALNLSGYKDRPQHAVELDGYKLFKPRWDSEAEQLHDVLKFVNDYWEDVDLLRHLTDYKELFQLYRVVDNAEAADVEKILRDSPLIDDTYVDELKEKVEGWEDATEWFADYAREDLHKAQKGDKYNGGLRHLAKMKDKMAHLRMELDVLYGMGTYDPERGLNADSLDELLDEMESIRDEIHGEVGENWFFNEDAHGTDSASTRLMKRHGWEGVDVRHIKSFDNTEFGSVVYDLRQERQSTRSAEFKNWFGDSVVTVDGKPGSAPKVMWHGSPKKGITTFVIGEARKENISAFGRGLYFTDRKDTAEAFRTKDGDLYGVYLKAEKPLTVRTADADKLITAKGVSGSIAEQYRKGVKELKSTENEYEALRTLMSVFGVKAVRDAGYDAIIYNNGEEIVVFSPTQIKSATDNVGTYDPENPDIRRSTRDADSFPNKTLAGGIDPSEDPEGIVQTILDMGLDHEVYTDEQALKDAHRWIDTVGVETVLNDFILKPEVEHLTKKHMVAAQIILKQAIAAGGKANSERAVRIVKAVSEKAKSKGQAIQALAMWSKLSPEGILLRADQIISGARTEKENREVEAKVEEVKKAMATINAQAVGGLGLSDLLKKLSAMTEQDITIERLKLALRNPQKVSAAAEAKSAFRGDGILKVGAKIKLPGGKSGKVLAYDPDTRRYQLLVDGKKGWTAPLATTKLSKRGSDEEISFDFDANALELEVFAEEWKDLPPEKEKAPKKEKEEPIPPTPEERGARLMAERVKRTTKEPELKMVDPVRILVNTLFQVAKDKLPKAASQHTSPESLVADAILRRDEYRSVWEAAKEIVEEELSEEGLAMVEDYLDVALRDTNTIVDNTRKAIDANMETKLRDVLRDYYGPENLTRDLVSVIVEKSGLSGAEAEILASEIKRQMHERTKEAKARELDRIFGKTDKRPPKLATQDIAEIVNLGALESWLYRHQLPKALGPKIQKAIKESGVDLSEIVRKAQDQQTAALSDITGALLTDIGQYRELTKSELVTLARFIKDSVQEAMDKKRQSRLKQMFPQKRDPQTQRFLADRIIETTNLGGFDDADLTEAVADRLGLQNVSDGLRQSLKDQANAIQKMPEGYERNLAVATMLDTIAKEIPPSTWEKINTFRTMAMLLNPVTIMRNVIGNSLFGSLDLNLVTRLAGMLDGQHNLTNAQTKAAAKAGMEEGKRRAKLETALGVHVDNINRYELAKARTYRDGFLGQANELLDKALRGVDMQFYYKHYFASLSEQMQLAKVGEPTQEMIDNAHALALYRTFQDDTAIAGAFMAIRNALNIRVGRDGKGSGIQKYTGGDFGLGSLLLPFVKTPANLAMRALDYSPAGFALTLGRLHYDTTSSPYMRAKLKSMGFARAIVGTGIVGLGYLLAALGVITGGGDDEDKEFVTDLGLGKYRVNVTALGRVASGHFDGPDVKPGDVTVRYDWLQPMAVSLAMGADIHDKFVAAPEGENPMLNLLVLADSTWQSTMSVLTEQSMVSSLSRFFTGGDLMKGTTRLLAGALASFIPSALTRAGNAVDSTVRDTEAKSVVVGGVKKAIAKIPGAAWLMPEFLPAEVNELGIERKYYDPSREGAITTFVQRVSQLVNPAIWDRYQPSEAEQLVVEVYQRSKDKGVVPDKLYERARSYKDDDGNVIGISPAAYQEVYRSVGPALDAELRQAVKDGIRNVPLDDQVEWIKRILARQDKRIKRALKTE